METLGEHVFDFFLRNKRAEFEEYRRQVTRWSSPACYPSSNTELSESSSAIALLDSDKSASSTGARLARRPDANRRQGVGVIRPVASRWKVSGSVSTTFGGVPRVWVGPGSPIAHCTAAYGTLTLWSGRDAVPPGCRRGYGCTRECTSMQLCRCHLGK